MRVTLLRGADAVVFAAGAGPGKGRHARKRSTATLRSCWADAAQEAEEFCSYVMISAMGADAEAPDEAGDPVFVAYLRAKGAADEDIRRRDTLHPIVRPGRRASRDRSGDDRL